MPLRYLNLDDQTRRFMVEEIDMDIASGALYLSPWLTERGAKTGRNCCETLRYPGQTQLSPPRFPFKGDLPRPPSGRNRKVVSRRTAFQ